MHAEYMDDKCKTSKAVITCPIYNLFQWYNCFKDYQDDLNDNRWLDHLKSANSDELEEESM